ncbi:unnamed protein product [Dovyalis caffra]|uniref:Uncharacterized protein n=1 Tax=Dovyalis caffra TaxID=77055 RepID=A0AAV1SCA4_9ROSI|nr:unnamed protein product [Dovyalis caffra]
MYIMFAHTEQFEDVWGAEDAITAQDGYNFDVELVVKGDLVHMISVVMLVEVEEDMVFQIVLISENHMLKARDDYFAEGFHDGDGATSVVDDTNDEDMKNDIRQLDDTEFRNPFTRGRVMRAVLVGVRARVEVAAELPLCSKSLPKSVYKSRSASRSRPVSPVCLSSGYMGKAECMRG